jgi:phosphatidylinositol-bisphosphatase
VGLRIRLGTFNVNGQFPSRDLSPWVQGHALPYSQTAHLAEKGGLEDVIPPLKGISPPSAGKVARSAFEPGMRTHLLYWSS